jgi:hypothetical protein
MFDLLHIRVYWEYCVIVETTLNDLYGLLFLCEPQLNGAERMVNAVQCVLLTSGDSVNRKTAKAVPDIHRRSWWGSVLAAETNRSVAAFGESRVCIIRRIFCDSIHPRSIFTTTQTTTLFTFSNSLFCSVSSALAPAFTEFCKPSHPLHQFHASA